MLELSVQEPTKTREERIRDVFEDNGRALSLRMLAKACITAGVWTRAELDLLAINSVIETCRRALRVKDVAGMPSNGPTTARDDDGAPIWKARQGWLFPDYEQNVREHLGQRDENHLIAVALADEAKSRYHKTIAIHALPTP